MPKLQNLARVLNCFHAASLMRQPAAVLIDKLCGNIGLNNARVGGQLLVNLHYVLVPEWLGLMDLLSLEPAVPPEPRELHPLR